MSPICPLDKQIDEYLSNYWQGDESKNGIQEKMLKNNQLLMNAWFMCCREAEWIDIEINSIF